MFGVGRAEVRELESFLLLSQELCPHRMTLSALFFLGAREGVGSAAAGAFYAGPYIKTFLFSEIDTYLNMIWGQHECLSKSLVQDHINPRLNFLRISQIVAEEKCLKGIEGYVKKSLCCFFF